MSTETILHAGVRIRRPFTPVHAGEHWPREGWKAIIYTVCLSHQVKIDELMAGSRRQAVVACRWEIIRRMRETKTANGRPVSLPLIGQRLGIDHSSVNYALRRLAGETPREMKRSAYYKDRKR